MSKKNGTAKKPTTKKAAKKVAPPVKPANLDHLSPNEIRQMAAEMHDSTAFDDRQRRGLRVNAFCEMSERMFGEIEELIFEDVQAAYDLFNDKGVIEENRLLEVKNHLVRATGLASALLMSGECLR